MTEQPSSPATPPRRLDAFLSERPDVVLMAPFLVYLGLLALREVFPPEQQWIASVLRGLGGMAIVFLVWRHLPPLGKPHVGLAAVCALIAAAGWFYGQYFLNWLGVPASLPLFPGGEIVDPRVKIGSGGLFWLTVSTRILTAVTTVAIVEELFWRGFLLRAFIDWEMFHRIPLGAFTWRSFIFTSLISTLEHPGNWGVSILCWFFFNALMYWKRSLMFLTVVHGLTNLFLYAWVLICVLVFDQQSAWMFM